MKKTFLILVAALSTTTFAAPEDASAQFMSRHRQRVARIVNSRVANPYAIQNTTPSPYIIQNPLPSPYIIQTPPPSPYIIQNPIPSPYIPQNTTPNPYIIQNTTPNPYTARSPKTVVAVENHSHQTLTVYIRWNRGVAKPFQILPHQVLVESMAGHNQRAELIFHEDLTGNNQTPATMPLKGSNVSFQRAPVESDVQWVKELHVNRDWIVATD